jgi:F-type H+-transporting ATPase subunit b
MKLRIAHASRGAVAAVIALFLLLAPIVFAAEGATEGEATSPLYSPNQGVITGTVTIVIFIFLVAVLGRFAWGPIVEGLRAREERIRKEIADAEAARLRAEETLKEYNQRLADAEARGQEILRRATSDAENLAATLRKRAQEESEQIKDRTNRDIEAARRAAVADIHQQAADLATLVAEKILRRNLTASDQEDLVRQSLDQMQSAGRN